MGQAPFDTEHWVPVTIPDPDDLMEIGLPTGVQLEHGVQQRWSCSECGAFVGQSGTESPHSPPCSGQRPVIKIRVYENGMRDFPAMTITSEFLMTINDHPEPVSKI
jgi:hypothetical protein